MLFGLYMRDRGAGIEFSTPSYSWAAVAGLCIGLTEFGYFSLLSGRVGAEPIPANLAIPTVVCGTVVLTLRRATPDELRRLGRRERTTSGAEGSCGRLLLALFLGEPLDFRVSGFRPVGP